MSARSILQRVAHFVAEVATEVADLASLGVREALLDDLGAKPDAGGGAATLPAPVLSAVLHYRDAVDPDEQADAEAIGNIATLVGAIIDVIEGLDADAQNIGDTIIYAGFDLFASTYVRRKYPRLFLLLQGIWISSELMEENGSGTHSPARLGNALLTILKFLWSPGRTLDDLDNATAGAEGGTLNTARDYTFSIVDGVLRGAVAALAVIDRKYDEYGDNALGDVIVGWDGRGLDIDSDERPTAADVVASRMVSLILRRGGAEVGTGGATDEEELFVSWLYLPRRLGTLARPHQLFLSLGGELTIDQELNPGRAKDDPEWRFRADIDCDAGTSWLIGGDAKPSATAATSQVSVSWTAAPNETGVSYSVTPFVTRAVRVELGPLAAALTLSGTGARVLLRADQSALVVDAQRTDSFVRKLLSPFRDKPLRYPFSFALGYDSKLGFIHEIHKASSTDAAGPEPEYNSSGPAGPPDLEMTLPLGGGDLLGFNIHEIVLRVGYATAEAPKTGWAAAAGALISFSTTLGPVYIRVDRLGLQAAVDTITPRAERNLNLVQAEFDASAPLGIAIQLDTGPISGGGTIQHNSTTGDYVGALVLRLGKRVSIKCIGLVSTRDRSGADESSMILIGTVENLDLQAGFVTFDGFGLLYAADRRVDATAIRAALPTGQLRHILFPADPVKHLPELVSALTSFFPVQHGVHCYGILAKLYFGAGHPIVRADLCLLLERDSQADKSRLILLGRISSALPQDKNAILRLNLDSIGVFDLDTGDIAVDAVLYDSKLCGRFVLTGSAAFRRTPGEGFALAVGGFNPRFQPPSGFPALARITVALTAGDNPKLIVEAYFALTSNTVQFGARASLYASAYGFSIEGYVEFHALIQLWPPHFIVDFGAGVQLKRGSRNLFKVDVKGTLEGPIPLRLAGSAKFSLLWWDYSVGFDKTLIGGSDDVVTEVLDVLAELIARLALPASWRSEPLPIAASIVSVRNGGGGADGSTLSLHPLGRLEVRQGLVPLNLDRDIDRVGAFVPANDNRRFAITAAGVGGSTGQRAPVYDDFADGQFFDMTDAERLSAPDFVRREAGASFGLDDYRTDESGEVSSPFEYTEILIGDDGKAVLLPEPQPPSVLIFEAAFLVSPAARAATRTGRVERYAEAVLVGAPRLAPLRRRA